MSSYELIESIDTPKWEKKLYAFLEAHTVAVVGTVIVIVVATTSIGQDAIFFVHCLPNVSAVVPIKKTKTTTTTMH